MALRTGKGDASRRSSGRPGSVTLRRGLEFIIFVAIALELLEMKGSLSRMLRLNRGDSIAGRRSAMNLATLDEWPVRLGSALSTGTTFRNGVGAYEPRPIVEEARLALRAVALLAREPPA